MRLENMEWAQITAKIHERTARLNSKTGKILGVLLLSMLMATASASVFVTYYGNTTATVQSPDVQLVAGSDHGGTGYPSASVTVASTLDYASIEISIFASEVNSPQPATYFTDLLQIYNPSAVNHSVMSVLISDISDPDNVLGEIVVYYCISQTDDPANNNNGSFVIDSTTGGNVLSAPETLGAGDTHYIAVVAYASDTASVGDSVTFAIAIQWA